MKDRVEALSRRMRRKKGLRKRIRGTAERPRLTVFRSDKHIYVQLIDDLAGRTICSASTRAKDLRDRVSNGRSKEAAKLVGQALAEAAVSKQVSMVCFDRNGYRYGGRIKALADAVREAGLKF
ncbi:MAG: 50S ribosomal protein L18 [Phycisphaerae bacterium]|nr:50S ribosomal protein L18 [Phycisphaerae bacterium]